MQAFVNEMRFVPKNTTMELFEAIFELKTQLKEVLQTRINEITNEFLLSFESVGQETLSSKQL